MTFRLPLAVALFALPGTAAEPLPAGAFARLGSAGWRHGDQPLVVAIHPDGKSVASGGADGVVRVWEVATGKVLHTIQRKELSVSLLAYSADGQWLAASFGDEMVRLFGTLKYAEARAVPVKGTDHIGLSADGALLVVSGPLGGAQLLEVATGQERMELPKGRAAAIRPDGGAVAASDEANAVRVLEVPSGKPIQTFPALGGDGANVSHLAFHPDGKRLAVATGGKSPTVRVFDFGQKEPRFSVAGDGPVAFVGETAVVGRLKGQLAVWDGATGKLLRTLGEGVTAFAASAEGGFAATDGGALFPSPRVFLWDLKTGDARNRAKDEVVDLRAAVPHPAGGLAVPTGTRLLRWSPADAKPTDLLNQPVRAVARLGDSLAVVTEADTVFDLKKSDRPFAKLPAGVRLLAADATGKTLACATGSDDAPQLAVVDVAKGEAVRTWPLPAKPLAVAVDPAGTRVAVVGRDGYARVWAADANGQGKTPPELWKERTARSFRAGIAFSPDGTRLAFTSLMRVNVHEAATGKLLASFERQYDDGPYTSLAFTPDGRYLAAGTQGTGGSAVLWELLTRQRAGRFAAGNTVTGVAFLDGGRTLVTTGSDDNLLAWDRTSRRGKAAPMAADRTSAWARLSDPDGETAYAAIATLTASGAAGTAFVRQQLADETKLMDTIARLIGELDSKEFAVRDTATKQLAGIGGPVLAALDAAEKKPQSAEWTQRAKTVRGRIQMAAEALPDPSLVGVPLRLIRAVAALDGLPDSTPALETIRDLGGPAGEDAKRALAGRKK